MELLIEEVACVAGGIVGFSAHKQAAMRAKPNNTASYAGYRRGNHPPHRLSPCFDPYDYYYGGAVLLEQKIRDKSSFKNILA